MGRTTQYSTADVAPKDRFAYWREAVCDSYVQLGCESLQPADFNGEIQIERYSVLNISRVSGSAHQVERRPRDIMAASDAFFLISLQTVNTSQITQFGTATPLQPGDMGLYDSTHPYRLELSEGFEQTVLQLPRDKLLARLPTAQVMGGARIDGRTGLGRLVRENILAFSDHLNGDDPLVEALLQETLIDLVATGLASCGAGALDLSSPEQQVMLRARSYIGANIRDPALDRHGVAEAVGLSVRRLNGIFAKENTSIAEEVRRRRLETVAADLRHPGFSAMSISEIAMNAGYNNLQHFSTTFRSAFGVSPRDYRNGQG